MDIKEEIKKLKKDFDEKLKVIEKKYKKEKYLSYPKKKLQDFTWAEIKEIDRLGLADKYFTIKDSRVDELQLTGEKITTMVFNLKPLVLSFEIDGDFDINPTYQDKNGKRIYWETSKMRNVYMKRIFALLPKEMQDVIAETTIDTDLGKCKDKLWLFSRDEIKKEKFDFFKNYSWRELNKNRWFWTRSAYPNATNYFCGINNTGYIYDDTVTLAYGVRLGFNLNPNTPVVLVIYKIT